AARKYSEQAYKAEPNNAFTLNNMGYLAELDGDKETAQDFYRRAKDAEQAHKAIGVATKRDVEGQALADVASITDQKVDATMQAALAMKRRQGGPILLKRRDGTAIVEPLEPPKRAPEPTLPASDQPPAQLLPPLPDNQQPPSASPAANPPVGNPPASNQPATNQPT